MLIFSSLFRGSDSDSSFFGNFLVGSFSYVLIFLFGGFSIRFGFGFCSSFINGFLVGFGFGGAGGGVLRRFRRSFCAFLRPVARRTGGSIIVFHAAFSAFSVSHIQHRGVIRFINFRARLDHRQRKPPSQDNPAS